MFSDVFGRPGTLPYVNILLWMVIKVEDDGTTERPSSSTLSMMAKHFEDGKILKIMRLLWPLPSASFSVFFFLPWGLAHPQA